MLRALPLAILLVSAIPAFAQTKAESLFEAMGMTEMLAIMREEGLAYSETLERDMFPGAGGDRWQMMVSDIYDPDRMASIVVPRLEETLGGENVDPLRAFFEAPLGQRIVGLELSARRAMLEEPVEEMARENWRGKNIDTDARQMAITRFIEANDLIETNVASALNSNLAFYQGLARGNALADSMTAEDMLREVAMQEEDIRTETTEWVYSYLTLAYQPLETGDLEAYIALSEAREGQALNAALFGAFNELFDIISHDLGFAASQFLVGEDI